MQASERRRSATISNESLGPDLLCVIVNQVPLSLERWQLAAGLAMAGGFRKAWKEHLSGLWTEDAKHPLVNPSGGDATTGPYTTLAELRKAARSCNLQEYSKSSKAELMAAVPQTVPAVIVSKAQEWIKKAKAKRDFDAFIHSRGNNEDRITATTARSEYKLTDTDLDGLRCEHRRNPHYKSAAPMRLYAIRDVVQLAYQKHGGASGLDAAKAKDLERQQRREDNVEKQRNDRREVLENALVSHGLTIDYSENACTGFLAAGRPSLENVIGTLRRKVSLIEALRQRGLDFREDSRLCREYIQGTTLCSLEDIVDIMHEMAFYFKHTRYQLFHDQKWRYEKEVYGWVDASAKDEISAVAKRKAWRDFVKRNGKDAILEMPDLPPTLRATLG